VLIGLMAVEGDYTTSTRAVYFDEKPKLLEPAHPQENR
jgi:hypothetical protein